VAVYTHISEAEADAFLREYSVGALERLIPISGGVTNSNYIVTTARAKAVLTILETIPEGEELSFYLETMRKADEGGVPAPAPFPRKDGSYVGTLRGKPAVLCSFLSGEIPRRVGNAHMQALGEALGRFHVAARGIQGAPPNGWGPAGCESVHRRLRPAIRAYDARVEETVAEELSYLAERMPKDLPQGVIHGDLFPDNVLFDGERLTGMLDFYFACRDALLYDVAICLNAWCFEASDGAFNFTKASRFLRAYLSVRPQEAGEIEHLPVLCRAAALRFLLSRLQALLPDASAKGDALVAHHDPEEYRKRLEFHRRIGGYRQYADA
jgi:homoserine kinase type II